MKKITIEILIGGEDLIRDLTYIREQITEEWGYEEDIDFVISVGES